MAKYDFYVDVDFHQKQAVKVRVENLASAPSSPVAGQVYYNTSDNFFYGYNGTTWVNLSQIVSSPAVVKGAITNANTNPSFPSTPSAGDIWFITTNAGTVGGETVEIGDQLMYSGSGWFVLQRNLQYATTSVAGYVELATQSEVNAGSDATRAVTPATLAGFLTNYLYARKVVTQITTLTADTPETITHGLNLAASNEVTVTCWQGGKMIGLSVEDDSVNAITVESGVTLSNVTIICQG